MTKIDTLLSERIGVDKDFTKIKALAKQSADGTLTSFSGLFKIGELSSSEKTLLEEILRHHHDPAHDIERDLHSLIAITSEVKAIHNQAALLHGERIKRVQALLKSYKEGAFSAWLVAAYGNRQTPYNFLLYYDFCQALPRELRLKVESMPRQAVYTLASRQAPIEKKQELIESYAGETKREMLERIRSSFPLDKNDGRKSDDGELIFKQLSSCLHTLKKAKSELSSERKEEIRALLKKFISLLS